MDAWDAEVRASLMADGGAAPSSSPPLSLRSGIHLPFAVLHEDERRLFDTILTPSHTTSHGFKINYTALDAWIEETEQMIDAEMK